MSVLAIGYIVGLCQAAFLVVALASLRVRNRFALNLLIALIAVFSILLGETAADELRISPGIGLGLAIEFALAPVMYLFVRALYLSEPDPPQRMALHFLPLAIASVALVWLNIGFPGNVSLSNPAMRSLVAAIVFTKIAFFTVYAVATFRQPIPASASAERRQALRPIRWLLAVFYAAYAFVAGSFVAFFWEIPWAPDSDIIGGIVVAISLYAIGYFALVNRDVFDLRDRYAASPMSADEAAALQRKVEAYFDAGEAYRDPELNLNRVARALGLRPSQISQALNSSGEGGFGQLLNQRRLRAYLVDRTRPENENKTILELAFAAGFNSKATFYRVLRAASGDETKRLVAQTQPKSSQRSR